MTIAIDPEPLRQKYREERDKRLRADGIEQYIRIAHHFPEYLDDPYMPVVDRTPKLDHVTFALVGGGFAGLLTGARLHEVGISDVRIIDKAGDFGGTWYWNRYPGCLCDVESYCYLPLLEETGFMPTRKYAHASEIFEYCQLLGRQFEMYPKALFQTEVTGMVWDESINRWMVTTSRNDQISSRFVVIAGGVLHK